MSLCIIFLFLTIKSIHSTINHILIIQIFIMNNELTQYIDLMSKQGKSKDEIEAALINAGWSQSIVKEAVYANGYIPVPKPPVNQSILLNESSTNNKFNGVKSLNTHNSFMIGLLYVFNFISLWIGEIALIVLLTSIIDNALPNKIDSYYSSNTGAINSSLSCLIVCAPIFLFLFIYLKRQIIIHPEFRTYKLRKFLIILTLVSCFITMITYLIILINSFLNGNATFNFILQLLVVSFLLGIVFIYYFIELSSDKKFIS